MPTAKKGNFFRGLHPAFREVAKVSDMFLKAERTVEYLAEGIRIEFGEEVYRVGFDKKKLAKRLGVPVSRIPKILGGEGLTIETMAIIADELGREVSIGLVPRRLS